ncbi:hypothetical protein BG015_000099 [Linnemannia schmuckeri]|uniref:Uncharacterized protein n=1 Tax=Linnemannia schmuckeri TaxID=64567 RepID=A0A9P5RUZ2_9FUNG|nr:hypothetical protein BG015_000099 [Linnemannia schmuckeri]
MPSACRNQSQPNWPYANNHEMSNSEVPSVIAMESTPQTPMTTYSSMQADGWTNPSGTYYENQYQFVSQTYSQVNGSFITSKNTTTSLITSNPAFFSATNFNIYDSSRAQISHAIQPSAATATALPPPGIEHLSDFYNLNYSYYNNANTVVPVTFPELSLPPPAAAPPFSAPCGGLLLTQPFRASDEIWYEQLLEEDTTEPERYPPFFQDIVSFENCRTESSRTKMDWERRLQERKEAIAKAKEEGIARYKAKVKADAEARSRNYIQALQTDRQIRRSEDQAQLLKSSTSSKKNVSRKDTDHTATAAEDGCAGTLFIMSSGRVVDAEGSAQLRARDSWSGDTYRGTLLVQVADDHLWATKAVESSMGYLNSPGAQEQLGLVLSGEQGILGAKHSSGPGEGAETEDKDGTMVQWVSDHENGAHSEAHRDTNSPGETALDKTYGDKTMTPVEASVVGSGGVSLALKDNDDEQEGIGQRKQLGKANEGGADTHLEDEGSQGKDHRYLKNYSFITATLSAVADTTVPPAAPKTVPAEDMLTEFFREITAAHPLQQPNNIAKAPMNGQEIGTTLNSNTSEIAHRSPHLLYASGYRSTFNEKTDSALVAAVKEFDRWNTVSTTPEHKSQKYTLSVATIALQSKLATQDLRHHLDLLHQHASQEMEPSEVDQPGLGFLAAAAAVGAAIGYAFGTSVLALTSV